MLDDWYLDELQVVGGSNFAGLDQREGIVEQIESVDLAKSFALDGRSEEGQVFGRVLDPVEALEARVQLEPVVGSAALQDDGGGLGFQQNLFSCSYKNE
jgi:hypothetical protein